MEKISSLETTRELKQVAPLKLISWELLLFDLSNGSQGDPTQKAVFMCPDLEFTQ